MLIPAALTTAGLVLAQTPPAAPPPPFTSSAAVYSGVSGPGKPVVGNGGGGYRSGYEGLMYDGPNPKPGWLPLGKYVCTSSVVKAGLLPPLKPIWDVHLRDTIINIGGDGLYYMTGSTGDNIWDRNDGIELYRSPDLQHWDYLGLVWSFEKDATWQKKWGSMANHTGGVNAVRDIWAPPEFSSARPENRKGRTSIRSSPTRASPAESIRLSSRTMTASSTSPPAAAARSDCSRTT
jgi:hypothetical protein